jgi:hypothetical protein
MALSSPTRSAAAALALGAVFALLPCGCRGPIRPPAAAAPTRVSPVVRGSGAGLETWYWVVSDQRIARHVTSDKPRPQPLPAPGSGKPLPDTSALDVEGPPAPAYSVLDEKRDIEEVLAPYADRPVPIPDDVRRTWAASGLRLYAVPRADLEKLESRLRLVAPVQRQWLGEVPSWTNLADGPASEGAMALYIAGDTVRMDSGRLRLLGRAWSAPLPTPTGPAPSLRLELVPEHEPAQSEQERLMISAGLAKAEQRGVRFERLATGVSLTSDDALVIVPTARPGPEDPVAPFRVRPRSLGEAMLTWEGTETTARARAVIVLLPHIAERFELLGP